MSEIGDDMCLKEICMFLSEYSARLLGSGVTSIRLERNVRRMAESFICSFKMTVMTEKEKRDKSKKLAYLLRHDTTGKFDSHGYRSVRDLSQHGFSLSNLIEIIESDEKGRYEMTDDMKKIRARQGHSVDVDVDLQEIAPPEYLYHGTATRFFDSIMNEGLKKMSRLYVHLSGDIETATKVGERHGNPVILRVEAEQMYKDGMKFYLSRNNVWLTDYVEPKYLIQI